MLLGLNHFVVLVLVAARLSGPFLIFCFFWRQSDHFVGINPTFEAILIVFWPVIACRISINFEAVRIFMPFVMEKCALRWLRSNISRNEPRLY